MSSIAQAKSSDLQDMEAILLLRMYSSHLTAIQRFSRPLLLCLQMANILKDNWNNMFLIYYFAALLAIH